MDIIKKGKIGFIIISNSIIMSIPQGENEREISSGKTYHNREQNQIVGLAYIKAYLLEEIAIYPRVILDSKIINELNFTSSSDFINEMNKQKNKGLKYDN